MHSGKLSLGLIVSFLLAFVYQPQAWAEYQPMENISSVEQQKLLQGILNKNKNLQRTSSQQISSKLSMENNVQVNELTSNHDKNNNISTLTNNFDMKEFENNNESNKKERTFPSITEFITNLMNRRTCIYPCTLEAFQHEQCCPPEILRVPVPATPQFCNSCNSPQYPQQFQPNFLPQLPGRLPNPFPYPSLNIPRSPQNVGFPYVPPYLSSFPCCTVCTQYTFYGPPPCQYFGRSTAK